MKHVLFIIPLLSSTFLSWRSYATNTYRWFNLLTNTHFEISLSYQFCKKKTQFSPISSGQLKKIIKKIKINK